MVIIEFSAKAAWLVIYAVMVALPVLYATRGLWMRLPGRVVSYAASMGVRAQIILLITVLGGVFVLAPVIPAALAVLLVYIVRPQPLVNQLMILSLSQSPDLFKMYVRRHLPASLAKAFDEASQMPIERAEDYLAKAIPDYLAPYRMAFSVFLRDPTRSGIALVRVIGELTAAMSSMLSQLIAIRAGYMIAPVMISAFHFFIVTYAGISPRMEMISDLITFLLCLIGVILSGEL